MFEGKEKTFFNLWRGDALKPCRHFFLKAASLEPYAAYRRRNKFKSCGGIKSRFAIMQRIAAAPLGSFSVAEKLPENAFYRSDAARLRRDKLSYNTAKLKFSC